MSRSQHQGSPVTLPPIERSTMADSDEDNATTSTGSRPLSRNAQAQARLRARRKAYVESLEANVKRLQAIVDALSVTSHRHLHPSPNDPSSLIAQLMSGSGSLSSTNAGLPPSTSLSLPPQDSEGATAPQQIEDHLLQRLQLENGRLRRERDALRVQLNALVAYISSGAALLPGLNSGSDMPSTPSYLESSTQGVPSPASQSFSQGSSYSDNELLHLRSHSALELAALQAYFNLSAPSPQYPDFSATPASSSVDTHGTGIPSTTMGSGSSMDMSMPMRREGSSDGSEGGAAYRLGS